VNDELEGMWKEVAWTNIMHCPGTCCQRRKWKKTQCHCRQAVPRVKLTRSETVRHTGPSGVNISYTQETYLMCSMSVHYIIQKH
jgi:hypothetical protein